MKLNWKWIGFVGVVTVAMGIIFGSPVFRKHSLRIGADLGLQPSVAGILLGLLFLLLFIGLCYMATSLYGKPYQLISNIPDKKGPGGPGGIYRK